MREALLLASVYRLHARPWDHDAMLFGPGFQKRVFCGAGALNSACVATGRPDAY